MAPARLNSELRDTFAKSVNLNQQRRLAGVGVMKNARERIVRLLATRSDTHDWTPESRHKAADLFL